MIVTTTYTHKNLTIFFRFKIHAHTNEPRMSLCVPSKYNKSS